MTGQCGEYLARLLRKYLIWLAQINIPVLAFTGATGAWYIVTVSSPSRQACSNSTVSNAVTIIQ